MNRVLTALSENRCVLALSQKASEDFLSSESFKDRNAYPWIVFGPEAKNNIPALSPESLAPCTEKPGGVLVIIDPDFSNDSAGYGALEAALGAVPNKPKLIIAARMFNPFQLPMGLRLLKLEQLKTKSRDFLKALPERNNDDTPSVEVESKSKSRSTGVRVPQPVFLGRESEKKALLEALNEGGPILLRGALGTGKHWLLREFANLFEEWTLLEEVQLGSGVEFDSFAARLCEISGNKKLLTAQGKQALAPKDLIKGIVTGLQKEGLEKLILPVSGIESFLRRDGSTQKDDRLSMLLKALWTQKSKLPIVFLSSLSPMREGEKNELTTIEMTGLNRDDIVALFQAHYIEDVEEEHIDEILQRTLGHPFAVRLFVVAYKNPEKRAKLFSKNFLKQADLNDLDRLRNHLHLVVEALDADLKKALALVAHSPLPAPPRIYSDLGLNRGSRLALMGLGLLDISTDEDRRISVHPLVSTHLSKRSRADFDVFEKLAEIYSDRARSLDGDDRLSMNLWANLLFTRARKYRSVRNTGYPIADQSMEAVRGLMRSKRQDLALQRANELVKRNALNTEARLIQIEVFQQQKTDHNKIRDAYKEANALCATPELFHHQASWQSNRKGGVGQAAKTLARGVASFPKNARLKRRLAGLTQEMGQYQAAEAQLREALKAEPNMPDTSVQLAQVLFETQSTPWKESETLLREALRLDPKHRPAQARLGALLRRRGMAEEKTRDALWKEASELLNGSCSKESRDTKAFIELGGLILDQIQLGQEGDLARAEKLFRRVNKMRGGKDPIALIGIARICLRTDRIEEGAKTLEKALRKHATHASVAALGELYAFQGKIFRAEKEFRQAWQQAPDNAPEKHLYKLELTRLEGLIASGAAVAIEKEAEGQPIAEPQLITTGGEDGPRRDAGKTVVRRKNKDEAKAEAKPKATPEAAPEAAPEAESTENAEELAPEA